MTQPSRETVIENVFICTLCSNVLIGAVEEATCERCSNKMNKAGWFEGKGGRHAKANV